MLQNNFFKLKIIARFYLYKDQRLTWTQAADYCKARGGNYRLAFPRTLADIEAMRQEMKSIGGSAYYFWIGINSWG